jgi:hypothetical protein
MNPILKDAPDLVPADFELSPVWEYLNEDELGEALVRPVEELPVKSLANRIAGVPVRLANGQSVWSMMEGIHQSDPFRTRHLLQISIYKDRWFHLARYHDPELSMYGPDQLAAFLEVPINEVFPITYDVRSLCIGNPRALAGTIEAEPDEKLSRSEIIRLIVDGLSQK